MAHNIEPMDIDNIEENFDNKENSFHHSNVLPRTPCTEKGYEELDVSELNMKLRYSITPASSPMSKSYTAHCLDNRNSDCPANIENSVDNANLTRSFNSTLTRNDLSKSAKLQPLQLHTTEPFLDNNSNTSVLRSLETSLTEDDKNVTVTVTEANDIDENLSIPSSSSSALHTPEATTPTKEIPRKDGSSPIMRGLKSVLNMFRASQSPIPPSESEDNHLNHDISSSVDVAACNMPSEKSQAALASTPIMACKQRESSSKRGSPLKESIVFNEDLEKELLWKEESTILFSEEKIPIHKLFFQQSKNVPSITKENEKPAVPDDSFNDTVEFMDVSFNDSVLKNKTNIAESDSEFVDCETTFTQLSDDEQILKDDVVNYVSEHSQTLNKTVEELQKTTEECDNKTLDITVSKEGPAAVFQVISELDDKNIQEPVDSSVLVESKDQSKHDIQTELYAEETEIKTTKNGKETLHSTITLQSEAKPLTEAKRMNVTQDIKTEMPNIIKQTLDSTLNVIEKDKNVFSVMKIEIKSIEMNTDIDTKINTENVGQPLDGTVIKQSEDKPQTSPTLMNVTQNIKTEMPNDMAQTLDAAVTVLEDNHLFSSVINKAIDSVKINTEIETKINTQNLKEPLDGTIILQSGDKPLTSPILMNVTQDIRTEMLNDMTQALDATINLTEDKSLSSSVINNAIQSIEVTSSIDDIKPLDTTVSIDSAEKRMSVSNFIMNTTQNVTQLSADTLNTTNALDDKPVSASTFIMNATQNIDSTSVVENVNEDLNVTKEFSGKPVILSTFIMNSTQCNKSQSYPEILNQNITVSIQSHEAGINNISQVLEIRSTTDDIEIPLDATMTVSPVVTPISSSTFIMNSSQNNNISLATNKQNEFQDATVTIDSKDTSALITLSTFIKDVTNDIESQKSEGFGAPLDATVMLKSQNMSISSSTFVKDEKEPLDVTITSAPIGVSDGMNNFYTTVSNKALEQAATSTLPTKDVEISATSECLDVSLSADKSGTSSIDFKDITNQIIDPAVVNDCINALDITLDTKENDQQTNSEEITSVNDKQLPNDVLKPLDATLPIGASLPAALSIEDDTRTEINNETTSQREIAVTGELSMEYSSAVNKIVEFIEDEKKQLNSVKVISNETISEQVDKTTFKPDILENSENVAEILSGNTEAQVSTIDETTNKLKKTYEMSCGDYLPANIPLPDEDDLEVVPSKAAQYLYMNNAANSSFFPDVINDLDSSKIQDATRIDQVPINIKDHIKTADLISGSLEINYQVIDANKFNDNKVITEYTDGIDNQTKKICELSHNIIEDMLNNVHEKFSLPEHPTDSVLHVENNVDKHQKRTELETIRINLVDQPASMDISYSTYDVSVHNKSEVAASHNITTALNEMAFDPNGINFTEEKSNVRACPEVKIDSITVAPMTLSNINKVSVEDMEIDLQASGIAKKTETMESLQPSPTSEINIEAKKELIHEEIIVSENNSPYVFVSVDKMTENKFDSSIEEDFEKIENPCASISKVSPTPPTSPPIASKGYNFNFDNIDDPFATKTKIRTSPPADSPKQTILEKREVKKELPKREPLNKNRRMSYPVRPKLVTTKKIFNSTFDGTLPSSSGSIKKSESMTQNILREDSKNSFAEDAEINVVEKSELENNTDNTAKLSVETQNEVHSLVSKSSIVSTTSSSDQSIYLSAGTSSGDSITARNVFNLPEIDDMNFNPFATKAKIRQSPPPSLDVSEAIPNDHSEIAKVAVDEMMSHNLSHQNKSGHDEKDSSNASNTTCSSKDDKNTTVREVHTDDDDTVEGPFLEAEDNEMPWLDHQNDTKNSGFDGFNVKSDMMQFSDLPAQDNEDNELFIDAAAFEFLLNQNKSNVVADSGKESLFLKFDPLFAKRLSSEGIAAALSNFQKRQSTPKKMSRPSQVANAEQSVPGPSTSKISPTKDNNTDNTTKLNNTEDIAEDLNVTTSKPMMVVTPAVNPIVTLRKSTTPTSNNRRSITFTSPAIAVIDRLLSLSANNSFVDQNTTITQTSREQNEAELALTQLRELLAEKEINVYTLRSESKELKDRLTSLESQMNILEAEREGRLKKVNELTEKLNEKTKINKGMAAVVEEYERTIASLIAETEQDRKQHGEERARLIAERDEQTAHLASMEVSFSDLHSKYEKSKQIIITCKANEDTYKKSLKKFEENLAKMQTNYETLKQHATSKLNHANQELEKMNRAHESEVLKLNAMIKRKELHITSLEESLAHKTKANEELTAICDELINKVG